MKKTNEAHNAHFGGYMKLASKMIGVLAIAVSLFGCASSQKKTQSSLPKIDMNAWSYNEADDVYYQIGISYAANPADEKFETLGLFVPGAYFEGTANGDGTYSVRVNKSGTVDDFTAETAPFVIPIQTPGYASLEAPTAYEPRVTDYTKNGFIFIYAGARGKEHGAPAGVTDFKAAIRYVRYNKAILPGDTARVFTYGMSGGGAQSALMGATGDAAEYDAYLKAIGAVMTESDAVMGSMDWCPITNLDVADGAYEWELGTARAGLDEETKSISDALALSFAQHINELKLKDENGAVLTLEQSEDGLYHSGSYYDYLKTVIETSLNNFLADTTFPYNAEVQKAALGTNMLLPPDWKPRGPAGMNQDDAPSAEAMDGVERNKAANNNVSLSGTYETVEDYIAALNANENWVHYDAESNTAHIESVEAFMRNVKQLQKNVGAFDDFSGTQPENMLFGLNDGEVSHFDSALAEILSGSEKGDEYKAAIARKDSVGQSVSYRVNMYNPMYYLSPAYKGFQKSTVAKYWRIHAGIFQGDTAISTELDYYLALLQYGSSVKSAEFADVWGLYHTEAERKGTSTDNFIAWVKECLKSE